ncbi:MAG: ATP-binding protein [Desulfobacterales bacterium]|nr:ATP-binding protein [Desulfobacterales bacterium]
MKLIHKLTLGFASVALILAVVGGAHFIFLHQIEDEVEAIAGRNVGEVAGAIDIAYRVAVIDADVNGYLLALISERLQTAPAQARKQRIRDKIGQLDQALTGLKTATQAAVTLSDDDAGENGEALEMAAIADLEALIREYVALVDRTFDVAEAHGPPAATLVFLSHSPTLEEQIRQASRALFTEALAEINAALDEVGATVATSVLTMTVLSWGGLVVAILIGLLVSRPLSQRIGRLKAATQALQQGDRDVQVTDTASGDEVAELARAFNAMARDLKASTASIEDLNRQVRKRQSAEAALQLAHDELEVRVLQRTRDLERARLEAEGANRTKSEFLANMSHELRTPLNHIIGFTELIAGGKLGGINAMQKEYLTDALTSSKHLLRLINDILDLSKVEAGQLDLMVAKIDPRAILDSCVVMFKEKAMKHRIDMVLEAEDLPAAVLVDEIKLKQILYNLLSNAFKYTPDAGRVCLKAWKVNGEGPRRPHGLAIPGNGNVKDVWAIEVSDSGVGIPPENLERIFNPFEQSLRQHANPCKGTGLGLALTRRMVALHGGVIRAQSDGRDRGATFTVLLPEAAETPASQEVHA